MTNEEIVITSAGSRQPALPPDLALGHAGREHLDAYERHSNDHGDVVLALHQDIIGFGRVLLDGRKMYPDKKQFGFWVKRRGLSDPQSKIGCSQQERTACMTIAQLIDGGAEIEDGDDVVPVKLDLTDCMVTTPTGIMKWARKHHPHLFPAREKKEKDPASKVERELAADVAAHDERLEEMKGLLSEEPQEIADTITRLPGVTRDTVKKIVSILQAWLKADTKGRSPKKAKKVRPRARVRAKK